MSNATMSLGQALDTLPPEIRAVIEAQLKRTAQARQFQHVAYQSYKEEVVNEGKSTWRSTGIDNPNVLVISHQKKAFGKRPVGINVGRARDGSLAITNAAMFPVSGVSLSKDGRLSLTLNDTFNQQEGTLISTWMKAKYSERPASVPTSASTSTEATTSTSAPSAPATPTPSGVDAKVVKVALIKAKQTPSDENVGLVNDIMSQTGASLAEAVKSLATPT